MRLSCAGIIPPPGTFSRDDPIQYALCAEAPFTCPLCAERQPAHRIHICQMRPAGQDGGV